MNLIEKIERLQPFLKEWLLSEFSFEERNCGLMSAAALRALGVKVPSIKGVTVAPASARKTAVFLKKNGGVNSLFEKYAEQVNPLATVPGDILVYPSEDERFPALGVAIGNGETLIVYPVDDTGKKVILAGRALEGALSAWRFV